MNKKLFFLVMFAFVLTFKNNFVLFAQTSSNEQRLVGSWTNLHGGATPAIFNSNGTVTGLEGGPFNPTHWAAAGDRIVLYIPNSDNRDTVNFTISNDGRTLILIFRRFDMRTGVQEVGTAFRRN